MTELRMINKRGEALKQHVTMERQHCKDLMMSLWLPFSFSSFLSLFLLRLPSSTSTPLPCHNGRFNVAVGGLLNKTVITASDNAATHLH